LIFVALVILLCKPQAPDVTSVQEPAKKVDDPVKVPEIEDTYGDAD
jgi:hypothetical protein